MSLKPVFEEARFFTDGPWSEPSRRWGEQIHGLLAIHDLEEDWDGQGAEAPPASLIDGAVRLARRLRDRHVAPPGRIIPGVAGTVFFEWSDLSGYAEIEVISECEAEVRVVPAGAEAASEYRLDW